MFLEIEIGIEIVIGIGNRVSCNSTGIGRPLKCWYGATSILLYHSLFVSNKLVFIINMA